ncbi:hypothetical protein Tco_0192471, partial [Tanacetum coccineum]
AMSQHVGAGGDASGLFEAREYDFESFPLCDFDLQLLDSPGTPPSRSADGSRGTPPSRSTDGSRGTPPSRSADGSRGTPGGTRNHNNNGRGV